MIYTLTRSIVKLALHGFYHDIKVIGKENLKEKVPTIFISNHPSALMDPLVVSTSIGRKFHFIAAAEYFGKGFKNWLLQHEFNMIPVYRPNFYEGKKVDNTDMFRECYKALDKNGSIIIYPEGTSVSAHNIRSLKTGVMRIAKGFKEAYPSRKIFVQSIGVNYSHLQQFQSAVIIKIGEPIEIDVIDEDAKSIAAWTSRLQEDMKEQVLHVEDPELIEVVNMINWVFLKKLETRLEINQNNEEERFRIRKNVIRAIEHFHSQDPSKVDNISKRLSGLIEKSRSLKIPEFAFHRKWHFKDVILLLIGLPFFLLGLIFNGGPYLLVRGLFRKKYLPNVKFDDSEKGINPAFMGTISFALGTVIFLCWFLLISVVTGTILTWWAGLLSFVLQYGLGQFTLTYWMAGRRFLERLRYERALKRSSRVKQLEEERRSLLSELDSYREKFEVLIR